MHAESVRSRLASFFGMLHCTSQTEVVVRYCSLFRQRHARLGLFFACY
eukprot:SAG31_NODE_292_length_18283_cov_10.859859_11_plen_48_part_00